MYRTQGPEREAYFFEEFARRQRMAQEPCRHGHYGCSDLYRGDCLNEREAGLSDEARALIDE